MLVRDYTPADRTACMAVFESNVPEYFLVAEREQFSHFLDVLPGPYVVVEDGAREIVACGGYALEPGTATVSLCWGMVRRDRHRTGLGRLLLDARLDRIRSDALIGAVKLDTTQHSHRFFERWGFRTQRVLLDGYGPGMDRYDMRLDLRLQNPPTTGGHDPSDRQPQLMTDN